MKLELKHLAPYLPYSLRCRINMIDSEGVKKYEYLSGETDYPITQIELDTNRQITWVKTPKGNKIGAPLIDIKPILRPLSDLVKEIKHDGLEFTPIEELIEFHFGHTYHHKNYKHTVEVIRNNIFIRYPKANHAQSIAIDQQIILATTRDRLLEWHFDVFSLIGAGLAIDINTLEL